MATSYAGGKNRTDFFAANSVDTGLVKVTALTMAATNTAVTASTDAFLKANQNYSATITPVRLNKGVEISLDQDKYSQSVLNAADVYAVGEAETTEYYNDGTEAPTLTATGTIPNEAVAIHYYGLDPDDTTKMLCLAVYGGFKEGSGTIVQKKGERIKPKVDFVSKKAPAAMVIPAVAFDSALATGAEITIPAGSEFKRFTLTAA